MTEECGHEFGDRIDYQAEYPSRLGDGMCDDAYNAETCGYDNGKYL